MADTRQQLLARKLAETAAYPGTQEIFILAKEWRLLGIEVPAEVSDLRPWGGLVQTLRDLADAEARQLALTLKTDD